MHDWGVINRRVGYGVLCVRAVWDSVVPVLGLFGVRDSGRAPPDNQGGADVHSQRLV